MLRIDLSDPMPGQAHEIYVPPLKVGVYVCICMYMYVCVRESCVPPLKVCVCVCICMYVHVYVCACA